MVAAPSAPPSPLTAAAPLRAARAPVSGLERALFGGGLAAITIHLLDRAFAGPATSLLGVVLIVAVPVALFLVEPRLGRATRVALGASLGLMVAVIGGISDVLGTFTARGSVTGWLFFAGGVSLLGSAVVALRSPRGPARGVRGWIVWVVGALLVAQFVLLPLYGGLYALHAPRLPVGSLGVAHEDVTLVTAGGDRLAAWYVPSRNRAAVVLVHGASSSRAGVADRARLLARHGYGVLALDLPGHGESGGRANMLGWTAQPAIDAAVAFLSRRPDVDPARIAGFGTSLGGEVLLEAAAHDGRLRAVVSDGAGIRSLREARLVDSGAVDRATRWGSMQLVRGIGGARPPEALDRLAARIPPRPALLIAAGGARDEVALNRVYRARSGASLWVIPEAGHTGGLSARPREYERRVVAFLDRALSG